MTGTIRTYLEDRGYGFIRSDEDGTETFFHVSECLASWDPRKFEAVSYEVKTTDKGLAAFNVGPLTGAA